MTDWDSYDSDLTARAYSREPVQALRVQKILDRCVGSVLDVGGGDGYIARRLMDAGHDVLVVEASQKRVDACRAQGIDAVLQADFVPLGLYGTVLFAEVFEHQWNPGLLWNLYGTLAEHRVVISMPLDGWPDPTHLWRISADIVSAPNPNEPELRPDPQRDLILTWQRGSCWPFEYWKTDEGWIRQFVEER